MEGCLLGDAEISVAELSYSDMILFRISRAPLTCILWPQTNSSSDGAVGASDSARLGSSARMVPSSIKFLAGAPEADTLNWSDRILLNDFTLSIRRYLDIDHTISATTTSTQAWSDWREIPFRDEKSHQAPPAPHRNGEKSRKTDEPHAPVLGDDEFLDYSFAVHADIQSSQLAPQAQLSIDDDDRTFLTENTGSSTYIEDSTILPADASFKDSPEAIPASPVDQPLNHFQGPIMSVRAIPSADHLLKLQPQTMTVNLVAGIISISPLRTVKVRRGNYDMDIIEIVLGDDTKAGFTLSSWHTPVESQRNHDELRETLQSLRPQDIVLVERLALSSYRGQVFGQSLNRRTSKNTTNVTVLCKLEVLRGASGYQGSSLPIHLAAKLQRVKDWVASFVGPTGRSMAAARLGGDSMHDPRKIDADAYLPPDSQP